MGDFRVWNISIQNKKHDSDKRTLPRAHNKFLTFQYQARYSPVPNCGEVVIKGVRVEQKLNLEHRNLTRGSSGV